MDHGNKIILDIDGVIAGPKDPDYIDCAPNQRVVERLRELKTLGYAIAFYTSRNVRTHAHNLGKMQATTGPVIIEWLKQHDIPYDELWLSKPWVGPGGVYVDDKAVSPADFVNLTMEELMNIANGQAFGHPDGNTQNWVVDLTHLGSVPSIPPAMYEDVRLDRSAGFRTALVVEASAIIPAAVKTELAREGMRLFFFDSRTAPEHIVSSVTQMLLSDNAVGDMSIILAKKGNSKRALSVWQAISTEPETLVFTDEVEAGVEPEIELKSRHFNRVVLLDGQRVRKTSTDDGMRHKLRLEHDWLGAFPDIAPPNVTLVEDGYELDYLSAGPLSTVLLRETLDEYDISALERMLADLFNYLYIKKREDVVCNDTDESITLNHDQLVLTKSWIRLSEFNDELIRQGLPSVHDEWNVNGQSAVPANLLASLLDMIPAPQREHIGPWHGDLCPGNILLGSTYGDLRVIDPRASSDGQTLELCGDQRYDLAKLCHALYLGYDTVLENWYDCAWETSHGMSVSLKLWDETGTSQISARQRLWKSLQSNVDFTVYDTHISSPTVTALAAVQLLTCAALHTEDLKRAIALFSLGIQAGVKLIERRKHKDA